MKKTKTYHKKYKITYIISTAFTIFFCMLFVRGYTGFEPTGDNTFHLKLNGTDAGTLDNEEEARELLIQARRNVASSSSELVFLETELEISGEEVIWGQVDGSEIVLENMENILRKSIQETMHRSYTLKVDEYMVNLASVDEVNSLLQAAVDKYDSEGKFRVELVYDDSREFDVLTAHVVDCTKETAEARPVYEGGVQVLMDSVMYSEDTEGEKDFGDYDLGILEMDFAEDIEIVESYLPESQLASLSDAIDEVTKDQEVPAEYEVVSGDTLSEIAIKVDIPMDDIVAMNDSLESVNSMIHVGQKLIITIPEPELSVTRTEELYYEEIYDAEVQYVDNDNWYTTQTKVLQAPSAGFRKVVADVYYINDKEVGRELLKEDVVQEAVAKIVERGTKIPPTYIRPISGGRKTSGFGRRNAPTKGASTYHKGVDWATPTGTPVYASCGGTVAKAGWGSGYGYVVYINHEDGRQTRYGHLSKILVKAGQTVKQGEKIALSGNTGVTTGPHLHFEILINGKQVDPEVELRKYGY